MGVNRLIRTESKRGQQATPTFFIPPTERRFARSVRHTYASLLVAVGFSAAYVQEQLGHASHRAHGRWLRKQAPGGFDVLDREVVAAAPETVAAEALSASAGGPKVLKWRRERDSNPR